jgi:glycosyltransferase involved in cell wall biosynthesis
MTEPLGRSQVVPYLVGLARAGWRFDLLGFEPASVKDEEVDTVSTELAREGIRYSFVRRSPSHSPARKLAEALAALARLATRLLRGRPRIIHARSYLPAAVGDVLRTLAPRSRFVFDCRGLLGDEYADVGHWQRASLRYRAVKAAEKRLFGHSDGVVVLTDALRRWLRDRQLVPSRVPVEVIPCCVDLTRFAPDARNREEARRRIGAGDRFVLGYVGSLGSWYCEEQIATLFASIARRRPSLLLVLTRSPSEALRNALAARGVAADAVHIEAVTPEQVPRLLCGADAAVSLIQPVFSKIASSPVKLAESLALGLPTVMNRGIGDGDQLLGVSGDALVDAGSMSDAELDVCAERLLALDPAAAGAAARALAERVFSLEDGVRRYRTLYDRLVS